MKILLVEDDPRHSTLIESQLDELSHSYVQVANAKDAKIQIQNDNFSLVILDIEINGEENGVDLGQWIRKNYPYILIIFWTDYPDIFSEGIKKIIPNGWLKKSQNLGDLVRQITIALLGCDDIPEEQRIRNGVLKEDRMIIRGIRDDSFSRVYYNDIYYFETEGNNILVRTIDNQSFLMSSSLEGLISKVRTFYKKIHKCHQSFAVNEKYISKYIPNANSTGRKFILDGGEEIRISREFDPLSIM